MPNDMMVCIVEECRGGRGGHSCLGMRDWIAVGFWGRDESCKERGYGCEE